MPSQFLSFAVPAAGGGALSALSVLGFALALGLKHATDADHLAAVSTIAGERRGVLAASLVGGLWGVGHTLALLAAGVVVILLRVPLSERVGLAFEFAVALMLVALGARALLKLLRGGRVHLHPHEHGGRWHVHPHTHDPAHDEHRHPQAARARTHHGFRLDARPLLVGAVHGLAGSAALMLLVLSSIRTTALAFAYIVIFGVGSIGGMMLMSALVGLPAQLTARRWTRLDLLVRGAAGLFSLAFGLTMAYEIAYLGPLFR